MDRDSKYRAFMGLDRLGGTPIDSSIYDRVFAGEVECADLEAVFSMFNNHHPDGYRGRSMSVSDVVEVIQEMQHEFWFCDSIGFTQVEFDPSKTQTIHKTIRVVLVEPGKLAREAHVGTNLEELQAVVGGLIEPYYPFAENICIVCNDEGKYNGMKPNRAIYSENGEILDIVYGPFFICDCSGDDFGSLSKEQVQRIIARFRLPERFSNVNNRVIAVKYEPTNDEAERGK